MELGSILSLNSKISYTMKKNTAPILPDTYYHFYNRGNNSTSIFRKEKDFVQFLILYEKYIPLVADTYAYCLIGNHFHLLVKTKSEIEIWKNFEIEDLSDCKPAASYISNQFAKLFNSYTQSFNKRNERTGSLFEHPFRRKEISDDVYFSKVVHYIHTNPRKHELCEDFTEYPFSSYYSHLFPRYQPVTLQHQEVLDWFGGREQYIQFHRDVEEVL